MNLDANVVITKLQNKLAAALYDVVLLEAQVDTLEQELANYRSQPQPPKEELVKKGS